MQINNIEGSSGLGKRITQNLSFNVGDTFSGEIINSDDSENSITIKMADGWKFPAKLENIQSFSENQFVKFEVVGFDEGKIVLDILPSSKDDGNENEESIVDILNDNGLAVEEDDISLLSNMIKHNMPLTKENVSFIKSLFDFKNKLEDDVSNKDSFINNFLEGNKLSNEETEKFENIFEKFSYDLKSMSTDQILTMLENNIDITPQNVKSFDNITFKFSTIYNDVNKLNNFLKNVGFKDAQETPMNVQKLLPNLTKMQYTTENSNKIKDVLAQISKQYNSISNISTFSKESEEGITLDNIKNSLLKYYDGNDTQIDKENFNSIIKSLNENKGSIEKLFNFKYTLENVNKMEDVLGQISKQYNSIVKSLNENKSAIEKFKYTPENANKIKDILGQVSKLYDDISNANIFSKDSKEADAFKNIKSSVLKYYNGNDTKIDKENFNKIVKALSDFSDKMQDVDVFEEKNNSQLQNLDSLKSNVITEIKSKIGEMKNMLGKMKSISLESPDNKNTAVIKAFDGKKIAIKKEYLDNVINTLKENINDFKVFNQLSNNYYYLDVPLNVDENKCNFRMIVKDNRHSGKKIDSKDVKFVVSLETMNMGVIDSYIRILGNNINVDIKCDKKWVNVFKSNIDRLKNTLMDNYGKVYIDISKKEVKSNIVTINDFFDKNNVSNIDVRV